MSCTALPFGFWSFLIIIKFFKFLLEFFRWIFGTTESCIIESKIWTTPPTEWTSKGVGEVYPRTSPEDFKFARFKPLRVFSPTFSIIESDINIEITTKTDNPRYWRRPIKIADLASSTDSQLEPTKNPDWSIIFLITRGKSNDYIVSKSIKPKPIKTSFLYIAT